MTWVTEFNSHTPDGKRAVRYQTKHMVGYSSAERPDRVTVSGKVVHYGWASDHEGYALYKSLITPQKG